MDEPVAEAPGISLYFIAKLLREHVTVALSGEGSDELFAGYSVYRHMRWIEAYRRFPESVRRLSEPIAKAFGSDKALKYMRLARLPLERRYRGVANYDLAPREKIYTE